ncbi:MAG: S8 family serine peptidase [Anaerolineales bacterium]|nr:S8 family serine peptidase [Anaerolineales bacterium]
MDILKRQAILSMSIALVGLILSFGLVFLHANAAGVVQPESEEIIIGQSAAELKILMQKVEAGGSLPVIINLNVPGFQTEMFGLTSTDEQAQIDAIQKTQDSVLESLSTYSVTDVKQYDYFPTLAVVVDSQALQALVVNPLVESVGEDILASFSLNESIPLIRADRAHDLFYDGSGQTIAIIDSGVDKNHPSLTGKVISEACFSTNNATLEYTSVCPGQVESSTAVGSGLNCPVNLPNCDHGTHVAGIASGVAPGAKIIAIKVATRLDKNCPGTNPCTATFASDQLSALNHVYSLRNSYNIASVNMSLGGGEYTSVCDSDPSYASFKTAIDLLSNAGIAVVPATGNIGKRDATAGPACVSSAISVGATDKNDNLAYYSNIASFTTLLAPGSSIRSSVPGSSTSPKNGTSQAAPHVAGAIAVLKEAKPNASVGEIRVMLTSSGPLISDNRSGGSVSKRRLDVYNALCLLVICDQDDFRLIVDINGTGTLAGNISLNNDKDHIYYNGIAGNRVTIEMNRNDTTLDPYLYLYDPNGNLVAINNNGNGLNARIGDYLLRQTGRYIIVAQGWNGTTGRYTIKTLKNPTPDNPSPRISYIDPVSFTGSISASNFWIRLYGSNFMPQTAVVLNGTYRYKYYVSPYFMWVYLRGTDLGLPFNRTATLTVINPSPGGGRDSRSVNIVYPFLGTSELVSPESASSLQTGISNTLVISWTHPTDSWRVMQNIDIRLRGEDDQTAAWVRFVEGKPDSKLQLLNAAGEVIDEGIPGETRGLVISDTVSLHLAESAFFGSGQTVVISPTLTFEEAVVGTYNLEFEVDNEEGEIQDDDVLGFFNITSSACPVPVSGVALSGSEEGIVNTDYVYTSEITPITPTEPISYTWSPEPNSGQSTAAATYNWQTAGEKFVYLSVENCESFAGDVRSVKIKTTDQPDLSINKQGPPIAEAGELITYTLTVTNSGGTSATNLNIVDVLPVGSSYVSGGTEVAGSVTWSLSDLSGYGSISQTTFVVSTTVDLNNTNYFVTSDGSNSASGENGVSTRIVDARILASPLISKTLSYISKDSQVRTLVTIPMGSVSEDTVIAYDELSNPANPIPPLDSFAGRAFKLTAYQDGQEVSGFVLGEIIQFILRSSQVNFAGTNQVLAGLYYWDGDQWSNDGVTCTWDVAGVELTCDVLNAGMTEYAIIATSRQVFLPAVLNGSKEESAEITDIQIVNTEFVVSFQTFDFIPQLAGQHVHFFFDSVSPDEAGIPGSGPWKVYAGSSPFTEYATKDRPEISQQMCILVANPDHSVIQGSGNCYALP